MLTRAFIFSLKDDVDNFLMMLVKIKCCKRFCFTRKTRSHYLQRRWVKSIIKELKKVRAINAWTGKLKIDKE